MFFHFQNNVLKGHGLLAVLILLPWFIAKTHFLGISVYLLNLIIIHCIVAIGLNILVGYTGQISLGHAGFFAIGAFTTVMFVGKMGLPLFIALPLGAFISAGAGFILGLPSLRLEGPYLAIATMGFGMAVTTIIKHMEFFGGRMGLQAPKLYFFETPMKDIHFYYVICSVAVVLTIAAIKLFKTKVGRAFIAIRDSDVAAETMGVNLNYYKTLSFAVSAFYTGVAGGLYAFILGFKKLELARVFGSPYGFFFPSGQGKNATVRAAAEMRHDIMSLGAEMGGNGTVTPDCLCYCEGGVRRVLRHLGVWNGPVSPEELILADTRILTSESWDTFTYASEDGLYQPMVELGDRVEKGQLAALIHPPETPWRFATEVRFSTGGIVICKRMPGRTERGDCLFHSGVDLIS